MARSIRWQRASGPFEPEPPPRQTYLRRLLVTYKRPPSLVMFHPQPPPRLLLSASASRFPLRPAFHSSVVSSSLSSHFRQLIAICDNITSLDTSPDDTPIPCQESFRVTVVSWTTHLTASTKVSRIFILTADSVSDSTRDAPTRPYHVPSRSSA